MSGLRKKKKKKEFQVLFAKLATCKLSDFKNIAKTLWSINCESRKDKNLF